MTATENLSPTYQFGMTGISYQQHDAAFGLPIQFVKSMRTLFDMLDDNKNGQVALSEIERRWRDDAVPNLPGVLDALRTVAPAKGWLTFENFVNGLRLAMKRARTKTVLQPSHNTRYDSGSKYTNCHRPPNYYASSANEDFCNHYANQNYHSNGRASTFDRNSSIRKATYEGRDVSKGRRRMKHRRSNSGPIFPAKASPDLPEPYRFYDDWRFDASRRRVASEIPENMQQNFNIGVENPTQYNQYKQGARETLTDEFLQAPAQGIRKSPSGGESSPEVFQRSGSRRNVPDPENPEKKGSSFDNITASTLFINQASDDAEKSEVVSMKPVVLSGKYIGIAGTLKRTKSSDSGIRKGYGSLQRPPTKAMVTSKSFHSLSTNNLKGSGQSRNGNASNPSGNKTLKSDPTDHCERKRTVPTITSPSSGPVTEPQKMDQERRCESVSPPQMPAEKSARRAPSSTSDNHSTESSESSTTGTENTENRSASARRRRANSASSAQRRRNARWNTAVIAFDTPMMKQLKKMQQKEDLLRKGLDAVDRMKLSLQQALGEIRNERELLSAKVEGSTYGNDGGKETSDESKANSLSSSVIFKMEDLKDIINEFRSLENTDSKLPVKLDATDDTVTILREDNDKLSRELVEKSNAIDQLENEKASLVRQLFQARSELQQCSDDPVNTSIFI